MAWPDLGVRVGGMKVGKGTGPRKTVNPFPIHMNRKGRLLLHKVEYSGKCHLLSLSFRSRKNNAAGGWLTYSIDTKREPKDASTVERFGSVVGREGLAGSA